MKAYAGIGSRETPRDVLDLMERIAARLALDGWTLRSGGAKGADQAFERGHRGVTDRRVEVYRPDADIPEWAFTLAAWHHPAWERLGDYVCRLHARNSQIVMGPDNGASTPPCRFVICWTPEGAGGGGTGQGIRVATGARIPVFDLALELVRERLSTYVTTEVTA